MRSPLYPHVKLFSADSESVILCVLMTRLSIDAARARSGFYPVTAFCSLAVPLIDMAVGIAHRLASGHTESWAARNCSRCMRINAGMSAEAAAAPPLLGRNLQRTNC
jgi:hypothetical protein